MSSAGSPPPRREDGLALAGRDDLFPVGADVGALLLRKCGNLLHVHAAAQPADVHAVPPAGGGQCLQGIPTVCFSLPESKAHMAFRVEQGKVHDGTPVPVNHFGYLPFIVTAVFTVLRALQRP